MNKIIRIQKNNIYPMTRENFDAIINHYFLDSGYSLNGPKTLGEIFVRCTENVELYEFEFLINKIIENGNIFKENLKGNIAISNLCTYALDAYFDLVENGSANRIRITKLFQEKKLA